MRQKWMEKERRKEGKDRLGERYWWSEGDGEETGVDSVC